MNINISNSSNIPIYEQISNQIRQQIMNDSLKKGEALPSMRMLARDLQISVITTKRAYEELERDGFIVTVVGKGSFVSEIDSSMLKEEHRKKLEAFVADTVRIAKEGRITSEDLLAMVNQFYIEEEGKINE